jgi:glycosyltransferase involved in cell wall biosynthesis
MGKNPINVIVPGMPNPALDKCVNSILCQEYDNFRIHVGIDPPDVKTFFTVRDIDDRMRITFNPRKLYSLFNIVSLIASLEDGKDSIIAVVDADDTLPHPRILSMINDVYEKESPLLTYGGQNDDRYPATDQYLKEPTITDTQAFRKSNLWVHHLFTFRKWLFDKINRSDFLYRDGSPIQASCDKAFMYPMIEMAGVKNIYHTKFSCYTYNNSNPWSEWKTRLEEQKRSSAYIKSLKEYAPL